MNFFALDVILYLVKKMKYKSQNSDIVIECENFDMMATLDCGQAFRWTINEDGSAEGIAFGKYLKLVSDGDSVILKNTSEGDFLSVWYHYFDFDRDYAKIINEVSDNKVIAEAVSFAKGIRVLRQDPWETLCSFIISQNNNIPRIKGIILRLCETFGEKIDGGYTFPSAEQIAKLEVEDLAPLRCGFRARYIIDAARKVASREVDFDNIRALDTNGARAELMKICGVGEKVADCTLLFGFSRVEALPKDVWIKRVIEKLFDGQFPKEAEQYAGIVQQYLFQYARLTKLEIGD